MKRLKIQDLEIGKVYSAFYKGIEQGGIYKIESSGKIFKNYGVGWGEASVYYNQIFDTTFEEIKKTIDWSKVPRGTKVQVGDYEEDEWCNEYFIEYEPNENYPFRTSECLDDNYTFYKMEKHSNVWEHCKIHPSVEIPDEWYKKVE